MTIALLVLGLLLLLAGGTGVVSGASGIASRYGVSPMVIGLTVVAFGTSAPELVVNIMAALEGVTELAFGNVVGSNLANIGLVLGIAALIKPVTIEGQLVRRELPLLLLATVIVTVMILDGPLQGYPSMLSRADGVILILLFSIFIYFSVSDFASQREDALMKNMQEMESSLPGTAGQTPGRLWIYLAAGIVALTVGGQLTIENGSALATAMGISPAIIGLVVVAIGTSMPELVTSVIAAIRNESDLCVGNVIGSNLFNSLFVLPVSAMITPLQTPDGGVTDVLISLAFVVAILPVFFFGNTRMNRWVGLLFVATYLAYMTARILLA